MHAYLLRLVPAVVLVLAVCAAPAAAARPAAPAHASAHASAHAPAGAPAHAPGHASAGASAGASAHAPAHAPALAAAEPDPVVFVHGWNSDGSTWNTFVDRFRADGRPADRLYRWTYPTSQSNATTASQLAASVDRVLAATGATEVDLVTHSMGALPSRYYLKNLGGDAKVDAWVSLAGPNHGTDTAHFCGQASCVEMRPGSAFLTALNAGDETPGPTRYATWRSPCDLVVSPDSTVALAGAVNTRIPCLQHSAFLTDPGVYAQVRDHIG